MVQLEAFITAIIQSSIHELRLSLRIVQMKLSYIEKALV